MATCSVEKGCELFKETGENCECLTHASDPGGVEEARGTDVVCRTGGL